MTAPPSGNGLAGGRVLPRLSLTTLILNPYVAELEIPTIGLTVKVRHIDGLGKDAYMALRTLTADTPVDIIEGMRADIYAAVARTTGLDDHQVRRLTEPEIGAILGLAMQTVEQVEAYAESLARATLSSEGPAPNVVGPPAAGKSRRRSGSSRTTRPRT